MDHPISNMLMALGGTDGSMLFSTKTLFLGEAKGVTNKNYS